MNRELTKKTKETIGAVSAIVVFICGCVLIGVDQGWMTGVGVFFIAGCLIAHNANS